MTNRSFGDSITRGFGASPVSNGWANLLWPALGTTGTNYGVDNTMVADMATTTYPISVVAGDRSTVMIGVNDARILQADTTKRGFYKAGLKEQIAWLALIDRKTAVSHSTLTGSWSNTAVYGIGKVSSSPGSKATFTVSGTSVFVSMLYQNVSGAFDIKIDGVTVHSGSTYAAGMTTPAGRSYGPMLFQFDGLTAGTHTVEIVVTAGSYVYVQWVAGNVQAAFPEVYVGNIIRASSYPYGGSDAIVADYNANAVVTAVSELAAAGLDVTLVDAHGSLNNTTDMDANYHPVNSGHAKIADVFETAMSGPPPLYTFEAAPVYRRLTSGVADGTFWIDDGAARKQISVTS